MEDLLSADNAGFLGDLYQQYLNNPDTVDIKWQRLFRDIAPESVGASTVGSSKSITDSIKALMLIRAYRVRGHLAANLDPLGIEKREFHSELDPASYGFTQADYDRPIFIDNAFGFEKATLKDILGRLQKTYCGYVGIEFMHIQDPDQKAWIQERVENNRRPAIDHKKILQELSHAELFEKFLNTKFPGAKRFGLEGGESLIPAFEHVLDFFASKEVLEVNIGMAHRGRLCVLANIMSQPIRHILALFQGQSLNPDNYEGSGDVKYHLGYSSDREFNGRRLHLSLNANPSHLEAVDPVVLGKTRAKQDLQNDKMRKKIVSILLHGDAAFAGQGLVAESLGLCGLSGYETGGTLHFIINNQIGFTTSPPHSRSSPYSSDIAKAIQAPIFHVNGDHPEEAVWVSQLAADFIQTFGVDAVVDMTCYRRFGHNEGDEPAFTQPVMYKTIASHQTTRAIYAEYLQQNNLMQKQDIENISNQIQASLNQELEAAGVIDVSEKKLDWLEGAWSKIKESSDEDTGLSLDVLKKIGQKLCDIPPRINVHPKLSRILAQKHTMMETGSGIDWATAEALAFGSLLLENHPVRLSGQDSCRGTFSQRHAVIIDQINEERYVPLNNIDANQANFEVIDSPLSEASVLGFEYGYSSTNPDALVLWEAQFGDFANGAQVIIDQFISSGEKKWLRLSGLVMLLPHGFEGQGPEHSSARLERYLQLCAEDNMQVVNCSTPANYFHVLRRQLKNKWRKPLIVMTPKSLLRHKLAVSTLQDMQENTHFKPVIGDADINKAKRVVLCSGKIYYDLEEIRRSKNIKDVAIIRLEQFYPFPENALANELKNFKDVPFIWCQEEPENMGAWTFLDRKIEAVLKQVGNTKHPRPYYVGRKEAASPATGIPGKHEKEQNALAEKALIGDFEK
jgi:2-oxoglutarate dehydrogenase E1 component